MIYKLQLRASDLLEQEWELIYYATDSGSIPFREWFEELSDFKAQSVIDSRLIRLRLGNFGKCAPVGTGIFELKIDYGPGYRVYFGRVASKMILLLCGGNKATQTNDIRSAQLYWQHYRRRRK